MSEHAANIVPRLPSTDSFVRELTPTWLATTALLAGQRPPDLSRPFRYVMLGCGSGYTAAVVAACHPQAEVLAWDPRPERLETAMRLRDAVGLDNLVVHERPDMPGDLGGPPVDFVVAHDVLTWGDDRVRRALPTALRERLRPGGLVAATYPTLVGWAEIAPVQAFMRQLAVRYSGDPAGLASYVAGVVQQMRDGGARYLCERPVVVAWLDQVLGLDPAEFADRFLRDELRPMTPAQMARLVEPAGCGYIGSAQLADPLALGVPAELVNIVVNAPGRALQEAYFDLAVRRANRIDVFRYGTSAPLHPQELQALLASLELIAIVDELPTPTELGLSGDDGLFDPLLDGPVTLGELTDGDAARAQQIVRVLLVEGLAHPVLTGTMHRDAVAACARLNAVVTDIGFSAAPLIGSAIPANVPATPKEGTS